MSKYGILFNVDKCIACQTCFVACKEENQLHPQMKWMRIERREDPKARIINLNFQNRMTLVQDPTGF